MINCPKVDRNHRSFWWGAMALLLVTGLFVSLSCSSNPLAASVNPPADSSLKPSPRVGYKAPDFSLPNLGGERVSLSDFRGKAVLINFWTTWCPPCREEMPVIEAIYKGYRQGELVVLGVNIQEDRDTVANFVERLGLTFTILLDTDGRVSEQYKVFGLPTSYFIDRDGVIREINVGAMTKETIIRKLEKVL